MTWSVTPNNGTVSVSPPVALYTATVDLQVVYSQFGFAADATADATTRAVQAAPAWALHAWPPPLVGDTQVDNRRLALTKLKALFDFAAQLPDGSADQIKGAVAGRWATAAQARAAGLNVQYARLEVDATVHADGTATWGYNMPAGGRLPEVDDLDLFVQNLVRADIQQRLENLPPLSSTPTPTP